MKCTNLIFSLVVIFAWSSSASSCPQSADAQKKNLLQSEAQVTDQVIGETLANSHGRGGGGNKSTLVEKVCKAMKFECGHSHKT